MEAAHAHKNRGQVDNINKDEGGNDDGAPLHLQDFPSPRRYARCVDHVRAVEGRTGPVPAALVVV